MEQRASGSEGEVAIHNNISTASAYVGEINNSLHSLSLNGKTCNHRYRSFKVIGNESFGVYQAIITETGERLQ